MGKALLMGAVMASVVMFEQGTAYAASGDVCEKLNEPAFNTLMETVAEGWRTKNTELALSAFTDDALYTEPPTMQMYDGKAVLRKFFDLVRPNSSMIWHNLWYNAETGFGAGEYSFHNGGRKTAAHGVAVVIIECGKIKIWREYQQRGAIDFEAFHDPSDKDWAFSAKDMK